METLAALQRPYLVDVPAFTDDRGVFSAVTNELSKELQIARVYVIHNFGRGVIRGFHKHQRETKMFSIVRGAAKFVTVAGEGERVHQLFVLSDRRPQVLVVPPGWYNGWMSLEESTTLLGMSTAAFQESAADDERIEPYAFGDFWTVVGR